MIDHRLCFTMTYSNLHCRLGTLVNLTSILFILLFVTVSFPDAIIRSPSVDVHAEVSKLNRFRKRLNGNDEVSLNLNISVDLSSVFNWKTKQLFVFVTAEYKTLQNSFNQVILWDRTIHDRDSAKFEIYAKNKYLLIDQGCHLLGKEIQLVVNWYVMHKTGWMSRHNKSMSYFELPQVYI
ncbi:Signal peptidase complex subunit 3B [Zostera marina]|uniref:Signal peptidase complex subunit 3 n=1 Tax=Zostera marina TaxID=29655 RepID=A0A0K9NQY9_ZOSMR|nr:Signal peptidase complex subunit 3B [Zostera marina]